MISLLTMSNHFLDIGTPPDAPQGRAPAHA